MGLDLKRSAVMSAGEIESLTTAEQILTYAQETCATRFGVGEYSKPANRPQDLSEIDKVDTLSNDDLALLLIQYTSWASFYNTQLAQIRAAKDIADQRVKVIQAKKSLELFSRAGLPKAEVPMHIAADSLHQAAVMESLKLHAMRLILEAEYNVFDKQASAISRLITLRLEDVENHRRGASGTNHRRKRPASSEPGVPDQLKPRTGRNGW